MERVIRNEQFLKRLAKSGKREGIKLLKRSTQEEYKSVVEVLLNAESQLGSQEVKKVKPICSKLLKLRNITKKHLVVAFQKSFKHLATLIGLLLFRLLEEGVLRVYCQDG